MYNPKLKRYMYSYYNITGFMEDKVYLNRNMYSMLYDYNDDEDGLKTYDRHMRRLLYEKNI